MFKNKSYSYNGETCTRKSVLSEKQSIWKAVHAIIKTETKFSAVVIANDEVIRVGDPLATMGSARLV